MFFAPRPSKPFTRPCGSVASVLSVVGSPGGLTPEYTEHFRSFLGVRPPAELNVLTNLTFWRCDRDGTGTNFGYLGLLPVWRVESAGHD